jgi:hypothetical protein
VQKVKTSESAVWNFFFFSEFIETLIQRLNLGRFIKKMYQQKKMDITRKKYSKHPSKKKKKDFYLSDHMQNMWLLFAEKWWG